MKRLGLALVLFLCLGLAPAQAQNTQVTPAFCNKSYQVNQGATSMVKVISGIASQTIGLCGFSLYGGAAVATMSISYGTGANCNTGAVVLVPLINVAINGAYIDHVPFINLNVPSVNGSGVANDLCMVTTGTGPTSIILYYAQF